MPRKKKYRPVDLDEVIKSIEAIPETEILETIRIMNSAGPELEYDGGTE